MLILIITFQYESQNIQIDVKYTQYNCGDVINNTY